MFVGLFGRLAGGCGNGGRPTGVTPDGAAGRGGTGAVGGGVTGVIGVFQGIGGALGKFGQDVVAAANSKVKSEVLTNVSNDLGAAGDAALARSKDNFEQAPKIGDGTSSTAPHTIFNPRRKHVKK